MENSVIELKITGLTHEGKGVGRHQGLAVFVKGALPGELVKVRIDKIKKSYAEGTLKEIIAASPHRIGPSCTSYTRCGGCQLLHLEYEEQLTEKTKIVANALERIGGLTNVKVNQCIGMTNPWGYRNKIIFQVGRENLRGNNALLKLGFFEDSSNEFVPGKDCLLVSSDLKVLANELERLINAYGLDKLKRVLIRESAFKNEFLLGLIFADYSHDNLQVNKLVEEIKNLFPKVVSIIESVVPNPKVPWEGKSNILYGRDYFLEEISEKRFIVSANSFFQVNSLQTEKLYECVINFAKSDDAGIIFDLYSGTGTITILLGEIAKQVYGIESLEEAVGNARENAHLNNIKNVEFILGKAETEAKKLVDMGIKPDIIVVDPPRQGCHHALLDTIITVKPETVIYVSCNPATLARDLKVLTEFYTVKEVQPVDMFPHTGHVECVVQIQRKKCL
ncbi:23S rRNA (uracil(1939)-C(5))-methyltransferase RlmD [Desulfitibacter alkalitolerans]|uniref:23S rRNA (uracil(1939)-C(5))-methyltransferase RlmD n=1 Tax=Desulfitibacter alkalitolerans TaxID=264641 RepID=UPI00054FA1EB|nr:23S rRNA (uracil(1939)-C(5))-methyltransferase RlmD [Desulfitibacter alkalitolerans]